MSLNSHKLSGGDDTPWGILLDPNHTKHSNKSLQYTWNDFQPGHFNYHSYPSNIIQKYNYSPEIKQRFEYTTPRPKVLFPTQAEFHKLSSTYTSYPTKRIKTEQNKGSGTRKTEKRKPIDYYTREEEYFDKLYADFDGKTKTSLYYHPSTEKPPKKDHSHFFEPNKQFFKHKEVESYGRPSYSSPDYFSSFHGENSNYGEDIYGYPIEHDYGFEDKFHTENHKYEGANFYPDKYQSPKYGPLAFALGLLPLGLLLASLIPTVVTIPVSTAVATGKRRKRSLHFQNPVTDKITASDKFRSKWKRLIASRTKSDDTKDFS